MLPQYGDSLSITDLERLTEVSRRTVRFYIKEGLLPPPAGTGGGARYGEEHYLRLILIRDYQREDVKLSGIRRRLDGMSIEQMRARAAQVVPLPPAGSKEELGRWLQGGAPPAHPGLERNLSFLEMARGAGKTRVKKTYPPEAARYQATHRQHARPSRTWERVPLAEGLEIHVRSDLMARYRALIRKITGLLKKF